jgi:beta-glucoside operon transcriptional antiterminator
VKISKVINNNVVLISGTEEKLIMGKGIGFGKKSGDEVSPEKIEKVFSMDESEPLNADTTYKAQVLQCVKVLDEVQRYAYENFDITFTKKTYMNLFDHMLFSFERKKFNVDLKNTLLDEIKTLYKEEFQIGLYAVKLMKVEMGIEMPEDEAGFIALNLKNSLDKQTMSVTLQKTMVIGEVIDIIENELKMRLDIHPNHYERLVRHLKDLCDRMITKAEIRADDTELLNFLKHTYPLPFNCAIKVGTHLKNSYEFKFTDSEKAYLTLHIKNFIEGEKNEQRKGNS